MSTEALMPRYADLDLWPMEKAVGAMAEEQLAAAATVQPQAGAIAMAAEAAAARLADPKGRLVYVGAGASGRIAVQDGVELVPTYGWDEKRLIYLLAGGERALLSSVEGAEDDAAAGEEAMRRHDPAPHDVVIGVSASGRTPYTLAALRTAGAAGALTIGLASNAGSPLLQSVAHPVFLDSGAEIVAGSTRMKAGTAQKIALNLFSTAVMLRLGRIYKGRMVNMRLSNRKLRLRAVEMVSDLAGVERPVAERALEQARDDIKLAVLIALGCDLRKGEALLDAAAGNLRVAIDRAETLR